MKEIFSQLRQKAEQSLEMAEIDVSALSEIDIKDIIHNLEVHRIELEMQNDELQRANRELEEAKRQYGDLFEFAPVSYLTLDRQHRITQANCTFVQLVGVPKECIIATAFTNFICVDFQDAFYLVLGRLKKTGEKQRLDLQLSHGDQKPLWGHVEMTSRDNGQSYLVSISDVTQQKQAEQALKASETKFRDLFNVVVDPMFIHDTEGNFLEVNESACLTLGYSRQELVRMNVADIDAHFSEEHMMNAITELRHTGEILFEGTHKTRHNRQFSVEIHSRIIEFGGKQAILSLARDLSRRKEAEQRYELLSNVTFEGILVHKDGVAIDVNASCSRLTGYLREELIGNNLFELIATHEDQEKARQMMMMHEVAPYVITLRRKDGGVFDAELEARNVEYHGEEVRIVAIRDVTERKRAEHALKESEQKYHQLFDFMPVGISVSDSEGHIVESNQTAERILGISKAEHEQRHIDGEEWSIIRKDGRPMPPEEFASVKALKEQRLITNVEMGIKKGPDTITWINVSAVPLVSDPGKVVIAYTDITEKAEQDQRLAEALQEKEVLLQEIHHRVKNNMQTIASLLYKQQQYTDDKQAQVILNESIQRVKSMAMIHEQIYRSKNLARINLAEYIQNFANRLFQTYRQKSSSISLTIHADEIYLSVDKSIPMALILNELITNALKYAFPDKRCGGIWIKIQEDTHEIILIVGDNGVGLPDNFDLEQANTLGIYLVYNLATKQLGGSINIHPRDPTEFIIRLKN